MEDEKKKQQTGPSLTVFGTSLAAGSAVLIFGGYWLDQRAGGGYTRTLIGLFLALLYVVYETWKLTRILAAMDKDRHPDGDRRHSSPP